MNNKPIIGLCLREACLELFWSNFNWTVYFFAGCISISFSVIACIQRQSCSGRFIFLHLSTLLRSDLSGSHVAKKLVLFWVRALQSFFFYVFFFSWRMQTLQRARNVLKLNSQISQDGTFVHYLFFVLNIPLLTFSYRYFFPLFVCFDILWQLATTHERDNTRDRDANSSRQNDFTWCDFLQGKQVKLLLSRSLLPQKRQKLYRSRFSLVKSLSSTYIGKSTMLQMLCCA